MNPLYALQESHHRWAILAAASIAAGCLGAMIMLAYGWSHVLIRAWLLAGIFLCVGFLASLFRERWMAASLELARLTADRDRDDASSHAGSEPGGLPS